MNLLRKYYDYESIGGGVPEKAKTCPHCGAPVKVTHHKETFKDNWGNELSDEWEECNYDPSEKLKEQEQEIERLKAENEGLRGGGWISVEDRLPDIEQNVLVLRTNPTVITHGYIHKRGHWIWSNMRGSTHKEDYHKITHWQPLPPPPKSK